MIDITQWRIAIGTHHLRWRRNSNYGLTTLGEYHVDRLMFFITVSVKVFITMHVFITMLLLLQAGDVESNPGPNFLRGLLFSGLDYWTGTLDWTTGLTYFWFLHILRLVLLSLASKNPLGTCSPLLNTEDKQWNMRKLSLNNFATLHYATIQHLFLTLVCSNAAGSARN